MTTLAPGCTLGIIGGGQLARMMAQAAQRLGLRTAVLDAGPSPCAAAVADVWIEGRLDDPRAAARLAECSDVITLDTEHVPSTLLEGVAGETPVRPGPGAMAVLQDRWRQREFLAGEDLPQTDCRAVACLDELGGAVEELGSAAILKTRTDGYDGKGQARIDQPEDASHAWEQIGARPAVLERRVEFERELSIVLARSITGEVMAYPLVENLHVDHVLHRSLAPALVGAGVAAEARRIGTRIAEALDLHGIVAVELFLTPDEKLLVNEIAPRTHNSGHFTLDACATSQFEQHVRGVCGLPLGDVSVPRPAAMINLLGDLWLPQPPDLFRCLDDPAVHLHLYGKHPPRVGRKMGHLTAVADSLEAATATAERAYARLRGA